jgi:small subunit ribosomal protein S4
MARYTEPVCRLCRRQDMKLFLKGDRCYSDKCAYERRAYAPGQHGQARTKKSSYGEQLREKQKVKRLYGVLERQFRKYFHAAASSKGVTGQELLITLERRLDNIVYRLGFGSSHSEARQLVRHRHVLVNNKRVNIPSYLVKVGDEISVYEKSRKIARITDSVGAVDRRGVPQWLSLDKENFKGQVKQLPSREDFTLPIREQLIVELYSK